MDDYNTLFGIKGHITSLKHVRKETAPSDWEKKVLTDFEKKKILSFSEIITIKNKKYYMEMRALKVSSECLKCHQKQGYKIGDIRGGVSIKIPLEKYIHSTNSSINYLYITIFLVWFIVLIIIQLIKHQFDALILKSKKIKRKLSDSDDRFKNFFNHVDNCIVVYKMIEDDDDFLILDLNRAVEKTEGILKENLIGKKLKTVFPGVEEMGLFNVLKNVYKTGQPETLETTLYKDSNLSGWRKNQIYKLDSGEVVAVYNDVTYLTELEQERDRIHQKLIHSEKLASLGELSAGIGHEINNLVYIIKGFLTIT
jgi:transcriptional regulator with PAS, ATPase and Fis domain